MAERLKNTAEWAPLVKPSTKKDKHEQIGKWVADVAVSADPAHTFRDIASQSSISRDQEANTMPENTHTAPNSSVSPVSLPIRSVGVNEPAPIYSQPLSHLPDNRLPQSHGTNQMTSTSGQHNDSLQTDQRGTNTVAPSGTVQSTPALASHRSSSATKVAVSSLSTAPNSRIHRLREPISTRKRSKKEEIILLRASRINGSKCPPWNHEPESTEFVLQQGEALFT
jgi:calpain-7